MKVLVIAPHPDDEILGCGGTMLKRAKAGDDVYVCIVTKGCLPLFPEEYVERGRSEAVQADKVVGAKETIFLDFPAVMLETVPRHELNGKLTNLIQEIEPDEVYMPHRGDMQMDHQMVVDAAMVAVRPKYSHKVKRVYAYETLSETGWNIPNQQNDFIPTVYEDITETIGDKMKAMETFKSQIGVFPEARSIGALEALAKYRGATIGVKAAEAFSLIREIK